MPTTQESFDRLLTWLDEDRENAGQKYESIRSGLIRIFVSKGFNDAEALADETIDRVIARLPDIEEGYIGDPYRYFLGVARNIIREALRKTEHAAELEHIPDKTPPEKLDEYELLLHCLDLLPPRSRELILDYYVYHGHDKVQHHRQMARELSITNVALRGRAHHIRTILEKCIKNKQVVTTKQNLLLSTF